ncbi:neuropilin-2-like isoform X1 [Branchiostoma floridae x Branchiostoma belcheri]
MKKQRGRLFFLTYVVILTSHSVVSDECQRPMGLQSGTVRDDQLSARCISTSPLYGWAAQGRLHNAPSVTNATAGAWVACNPNRTGLFLQVDFLKVRNISGLMTQGQDGMYTASYQLLYSTDGQRWALYQDEEDASPKVFDGNTDDVGTVTHYFNSGPITARYLRILPLTHGGGNFALRLEVLGCAWCDADRPCVGPAGCEDLVDDYVCDCRVDCRQGKNCQYDYCNGTMPWSTPSTTEMMTTVAKSCANGLQPWERALIVIFTICPLAAAAVLITFLTQRYLRLKYQMTTAYGRPVSPQPSIISYDVSKVINSGHLRSYDVSRFNANKA